MTYTPSAPGTTASVLTLTDTATGLFTTVTLMGTTPTPPTLTPASLSFGAVQVGSPSAAQTITAAAQNNDPLTAQFATARPFTLASGASCPASSSGCSIGITFTPTTPGSATAVLIVTDTLTGLSSTASISGTGTAIPAPVLSLSATSLNFNVTAVGTTTVSPPLTLTNTGTAALNLATLVVTGTNASDFTQVNTCTAPLAPGASCTLSVTFAPATSGARTAALQLISNASATPATLPLTGTGSTVAANTLIPGANALIPFTEGTGTVARDASGHGNDCTFAAGGNAPPGAKAASSSTITPTPSRSSAPCPPAPRTPISPS